MKITINPTLDMETLEWLPRPTYEYSGPVMECKKGRETVEQNMKADQQAAAQQRANEQAQYGVANKLEGEEVASTTPGSLSPAATARLASDRDQIANTYNGIRQTAFRTMGQRGFGSAPSGFTAAAGNAADLGEATQDTAAYRNAQQETQREREHAMGTAVNLSGQQGSLGNAASGESTTAAVDRSKMGSTLGDVAQGIGAGVSLAGNFLPGGQIFNAFSKLGKGSQVGGYAGSGWTPGSTSVVG